MSKNNKIILTVLAVLVLIAGVAFLNKDKIEAKIGQYRYEKNLAFMKDKKDWKDIKDDEDGLYLITSSECPYCVEFSDVYEKLVKESEVETGVKSYLVEVTLDTKLKDKDFIAFYSKYNLKTIPSMLLIKDGTYKTCPTEYIDKMHQEMNK